MLRNANFKKKIWDIKTLSSRVTSWILNIDIIINNGTFDFKRNFFNSIISQCNHLKKNIRFEKDPLVKLKQQEIDLKAMETQARLQKDMMVDAEKLDLQRDQLEANTTIDLMRVAADVNKEDSTEAMAVLKENMANTREAMKQNTNQNGRRKKATDET